MTVTVTDARAKKGDAWASIHMNKEHTCTETNPSSSLLNREGGAGRVGAAFVSILLSWSRVYQSHGSMVKTSMTQCPDFLEYLAFHNLEVRLP